MMTFTELLKGLEELSHSQGMYNRLYNEVMGLDEYDLEEFRFEVEGKFKDMVDASGTACDELRSGGSGFGFGASAGDADRSSPWSR